MPNTQITERLEILLRDLYGAPESLRIASEFIALMERHSHTRTVRNGRPGKLSGGDVILITYPDQLRAEEVPPLSVLEAFSARHLQGLIRYLHILPFYPSTSDDGFSVTDYRRVDPALGTWEDISRLAEKFGLMTDAVLNHASVQSDWFKAFLLDEEPYRGFFIERADSSGLENVVRPRTSPLLHRLGTPPVQKSVWTTFSNDQADLNYRNPRVLLEMADLLLYYADRGASILRLDAAAFLWKEAGTTCINLPQTHRVIQLLRAVLEQAAPGVLLATETNVAHADNISYAGDGGNEAHLIYNFALPPLVWHAFLTGDARILSRWVDELAPPGRNTAFLNFLASHDGIGLNAAREILTEKDFRLLIHAAQERGGYVSLKRIPGGAAEPYELNVNYFDALSNPFADEPLDTQIRRFLGAHALLLSLAGIPAIYFHSLFGSRGWPEGVKITGRNRAVNREKLDRAALERELADPCGIRNRVFAGLTRLIRARSRTPAFDPYAPQKILSCGGAVFAVRRTDPQTGRHALCLQEVSGTRQTPDLDLKSVFGPHAAQTGLIDLAGGGRFPLASPGRIHLDPYQTCWLTLREDAPQPEMERADTP
ncbi:MAG: sugar phosphorylase [Anaerolineales bacterium]|nr:sugar phosphorylase [Anaerolineales bacterium]